MTEQDKIARAICREKCAFYGDPPCFLLEDDDGSAAEWPNPYCDEPGCHALAAAVVASLAEHVTYEARIREAMNMRRDGDD
jgi:hypothetical protein